MRVLVVDDSVVIRRMLTKFIESDGTMKVVDSARDGQQALEKIQSLAPDAITLDVEMPVMDGLGVLARLRTVRPELRPAVLMCSTLTAAGSTHALEALRLGAADVIAKDVSDEETLRREVVSKLRAIGEARKQKFPQRPSSPANLPKRDYSLVVVGSSTGGPPVVEFRNITLGLGSFFTKFLKPIVDTINDVIEPIRPALEFLRLPLPGLNDLPDDIITLFGLDKIDPLGQVTLLDLLKKFRPDDATTELVLFVDMVDRLVTQFESIPNGDAQLTLVSSFKINDDIRAMQNLQAVAVQQLKGAFDPALNVIHTYEVVFQNPAKSAQIPLNQNNGQTVPPTGIEKQIILGGGVFIEAGGEEENPRHPIADRLAHLILKIDRFQMRVKSK